MSGAGIYLLQQRALDFEKATGHYPTEAYVALETLADIVRHYGFEVLDVPVIKEPVAISEWGTSDKQSTVNLVECFRLHASRQMREGMLRMVATWTENGTEFKAVRTYSLTAFDVYKAAHGITSHE